jgi:NAD(P)-dependent dehydrogenase (short-subunit alcohol dehydrogenase family)
MKKEILIFGSSGALGNGVTKVFLQKKYNKIYLFDFKHKELLNTNVEQIIISDLSEEENVKKAFNQVTPSKEKVFFLLSTIGGYAGGKKVWETDSSCFDRMINMNLKTSFLIAKYFSLLVSESHSGSICFTSAFTALVAEAGKAVYGSSKSALIHLVKTLAEEGKEIRLSANAIAPFIIDTPANREWMPASTDLEKDSIFESWIKPAEIGEFVNSVFESYNILSGNIFQLRYRFNTY